MITRKYFYRVTHNGQTLTGIATCTSWLPNLDKVLEATILECIEIWGCERNEINVTHFSRI